MPTGGAEGADVLVLGTRENLRKGLAKIGESRSRFGRNVAVGDGREKARECRGEVIGREIARREAAGDPLGSEVTRKCAGFFASVSRAKERVVKAKRATTATVGKSVGTHVGAILRTLRRHRKSPKKEFLVVVGSLAGARRTSDWGKDITDGRSGVIKLLKKKT